MILGKREEGGFIIKSDDGHTLGYVDEVDKLHGIGFDGYAEEIGSVNGWQEAVKRLREWRAERPIFHKT